MGTCPHVISALAESHKRVPCTSPLQATFDNPCCKDLLQRTRVCCPTRTPSVPRPLSPFFLVAPHRIDCTCIRAYLDETGDIIGSRRHFNKRMGERLDRISRLQLYPGSVSLNSTLLRKGFSECWTTSSSNRNFQTAS